MTDKRWRGSMQKLTILLAAALLLCQPLRIKPIVRTFTMQDVMSPDDFKNCGLELRELTY
jgi:hypothetical protein